MIFFFSALFIGQIAVPTFTLELSACQMLDDAIKPIKCVLEIRTAATVKANLIMFQHFLRQKNAASKKNLSAFFPSHQKLHFPLKKKKIK